MSSDESVVMGGPQVVRNAYIIAQSQLLQLAKQMEFDVDLAAWEDEVEEKMAEFWEQTNAQVDVFFEKVRANEGAGPGIVADVIKSPRKRPGVPAAVAPSPAASPTPQGRTELVSHPADVSHSDEEGARPSLASEPDRLLAPTTGEIDESKPERDDRLDAGTLSTKPERAERLDTDTLPTRATAHFAADVDTDHPLPLPSTTPGNALRTKRTLSTAVLRSTKKPEPVPALPTKPATSRFRSSFLNKSLYKAHEERQGQDESVLGLNPFEDSHDGTDTRRVSQKDTMDTSTAGVQEGSAEPVPSALAAPPTAAPSSAAPLDVLRSRLESVRRASTAPNAPAHAIPPKGGPDTASASLEERPTTPEPQRTAATPSRIPLALRSPSRAERPASRLESTPLRPVSRLESTARPGSRLDAGRTPSRIGVLRSPSRLEPVRSPSRLVAPKSPARDTALPASPWRAHKESVAVPSFSKPGAVQTTPPRAHRSPGRLRDDRLSPFRTVATENRAGPRNTPKGAVPSRFPSEDAQPHGFGARIKGLLGLQPPASRPARPASALEGPSPGRIPASFSPGRSVHTAMGIHEGDSADEADTSLGNGMPGAFGDRPQSARKAPVPTGRAPPKPAALPLLRPVTVASVRAPARPGSTVRHSQGTRPPASQAYTYDTDGKRRKVSQHPLQESTNQDERISTEMALKSKLTHSVRPPKPRPAPSIRPASSQARAPPTTHRTWPKQAPPAPNVFQQQPAAVEEAGVDELPDVQSEYSDSDDEASLKKRKLEPSWARGRELEDLLLQQASMDPDEIFGFQLGPVPLDTMLPPRTGDRRRARNRTSSANWSGPDGLAQWEIDRYNERMGIRPQRDAV